MAATLRPETMYGQTNCWVLPDGQYGAYAAPGGAIYVMAPRAARNLAWQEGLPVDAATKPEQLATVKGADLLGTPLSVRVFLWKLYILMPAKRFRDSSRCAGGGEGRRPAGHTAVGNCFRLDICKSSNLGSISQERRSSWRQ